MEINTSALKEAAKAINRTSRPSVYIVAAIVIVVLLLMNTLVTGLLTGGSASEISAAAQSGDTEKAIEIMEENTPELWETVLALAVQLVMTLFSTGFVIFMMNTVRRTDPAYGNLLDGFGMALRIIGLDLLVGLFTFLWSLLFIIPGIVASYSYRQAAYLLIDHPDWSPMECIRQSKAMMKGHKWQLFGLDLSFIGWGLLQSLVPVAQVYTKPYFESTYILYYQRVAGIANEMDSIKSAFQDRFYDQNN